MLERVPLHRFDLLPTGVFGELRLPSGTRLLTAERPWLGNRPHVSCIPVGTYLVEPRMFYRKGYMAWEITGVPGRDTILFHRGNRPADVEGCIVVGRRAGFLLGERAVIDSAGAWRLMRAELAGKSFTLVITQ